ncbi:probable calcium-binding protein CML44 [Mercurialis annua]|uniref:probable calcium-binding protein CML44 n=1 Tax=Mercurialis annua TaxID=3986 RepID=UPI002160B2AB|nr:probable calcium-binding protein CML44 [Mercurialis annua]
MCPLSINDLHRIFVKLVKNHDGILSIDDLNWLLERIGVYFGLKELEDLVGKSSLNFDEFLIFYDSITKQKDDDDDYSNEIVTVAKDEEEENKEELEDLDKAFKVFDMNGDGFISSEELQIVLERLGLWDEINGKDCRIMICAFDTNFDGLLDFQEFKNMMLHTTS